MEKHEFIQQFIASVSHEFRTPLASLSASLEIFSDELDHLSRAEMRELLNSFRLSVTGLNTLIDNLLDSASIEAGNFSIVPRSTHLFEVIADALQIIQPLLDRRQQSIAIKTPLHPPLIQADASRLKQVMINLLMNASKYSPQGEVIEITMGLQPVFLRLAVADRGAGIPESNHVHIFKRFVRLETKNDEQGIGLGLSVVKAIVEGHGGEVGVENRKGGGAVFWFTLPIKEKDTKA